VINYWLNGMFFLPLRSIFAKQSWLLFLTCMTLTELHTKLSEAYSNQNLNKITITLINLYKNEQLGTLRKIAEMINESIDIQIDPEGRYFSKLMMLYHPDRGDFHRNEINRLAAGEDYDGLLSYSHILMLDRIEEIADAFDSYEDIDYSPVYEWDFNLDGFRVFNVVNPNGNAREEKPVRKISYTFYQAVKIRMYGRISIGFPTHYLEDIEEIELSQSGIRYLDGVQYCIHTRIMDLSDNAISDISLLWDLRMLEELNLSDNQIEEIDTLANLQRLRTLNLSNNAIKDVSCLLNLPELEYIELSGTGVPTPQIRELEASGITVVV
jgi:Leucine-rich repeat (LRR) protein